MKIAIIATHPIQYHIPWFQRLAKQEQIELKVFYALLPSPEDQGVGFNIPFAWDIPMLEGYDWAIIPNRRKSPSLRGFFASSTPAIKSLLAEFKPDAAIITGWQSLPMLQALWACKRLNIPRIVRGDSNAMRARPRLVRLLHRGLLRHFDAFLSTGKANKEFYIQYGIDSKRIFSSPHFVDNKRFQEQYDQVITERAAIRKGWGVTVGHTCFLYAGKLEPKKRIMDLLEALDIARSTAPAIHLLVAGTGELMDEARQLVENKKLSVTFAGFLNQTEITRAYAAADCLVLPSDFGETWGLVVNEAMICGRPAIVSDRVGCGPDLVEDSVTGAIFPCGNINALADRLIEMASDPAHLIFMGERARERVQNYCVEKAVKGILQAVEYVTEERREEYQLESHLSRK